MSSENNLIWIFVAFVVMIEAVSISNLILIVLFLILISFKLTDLNVGKKLVVIINSLSKKLRD